MYNLADEGVQFSPTQLFSQMRRGCSASNGQGVQLGRYIQDYPTHIKFHMAKAVTYKMKLEALKHQGKAINETSRQLVGKSETADIISETESGRQVQRYIRLTNLIPSLLRYVDEGKIALTPAVALSYLYPYEQEMLVEAMEYYDCTPSLSQALYLKDISQAGVLDETEVYKVMSEEKANQKEHIRFSKEELRRFFPGGYSSKQMSDAIIKMLEARQRSRENKGGDAR